MGAARSVEVRSKMPTPATPTGASTVIKLHIAADPVVEYVVADPTLIATQGPRPYLHPVRTSRGTVVTEAAPDDHPWHLGVSVALQDVEKTNFWGGRTFLRDGGPTWLDDHGRIERQPAISESDAARTTPSRLVEELHWRSPANELLIREQRRIVLRQPAEPDDAWVLDFAFELVNATEREIELGSPATNGKVGGGYGGFFWRLPSATTEPTVFTADSTGEAAVHESVSPWLAVRGQDSAGGAYTLVFRGADPQTAANPWFVRVADYPGIGSSLAVDTPIRLAPGHSVARRLLIVVADGHLDRDGAAQAAAAAPSHLD
ncbi:Methane oxygenase PmoA [Actinoalloteichus hymeniacidonis]|uniref:Methane oxygenase PmoA n=2 Tax=Actinoalloteichus hymeniacidonis TaxID=340345 RepID=A0AAC9HN39_9PSEU|nr:Methane oxygenase PmoA [Actinoalloteichus hymeniacidonis]